MQHIAKTELAKGVYAALATPRRKNLAEPDTAALLDYLDTVAATGVNGFVLFGATGEFVHFDIADRMHALNLAIRRSRIPVLVNVSHSTMDGCIAVAEDAIDRGAAGLLVMPPYFFRYNDLQTEYFLLQFANTMDGRVPLYLYNLPQFTNPISEQVARRLLRDGVYAGIKDSSGSWELFDSLNQNDNRSKVRLLVGNESVYLRGRLAGADGIISGVAAALPELIVAIDSAIGRRDLSRAQKLNQELEAFLARIDKFPATVGIKQAASTRGWRFESMAVPLGESDTRALSEFKEWCREWMPGVQRECMHA
jgi:dihydrodipicolinate synthase/N-acetylneuraminate lyase